VTTLRLAAFILVTTAVQFAMAILGYGGISAFLSDPARVALVAASAAMIIVSVFTRGNLSPGESEDRANRWVLAAFGALALLCAYLPPFTDRRGIWTLGGEATRWAGVLLFVAGEVLRIWPVFVLGRRFSGLVAIQPGHTLVTGSVYGLIRNPSYLGMLVLVLGWALAFRAGVGVLIAALFVPPLIARIRSEERLLQARFGAEYEAYCARTSRLVPGIY